MPLKPSAYRAVLALAAALIVPAASSPALAQAQLSGSDIRRLIVGRTASWVTGDGRYSGTST